MKKKTLIKLRNITKFYGESVVLAGITLTIPEHTFISVLGGSGSGKSTLLRIIQGLETQSGGQAEYNIAAADVQFVFQHYTLFPWLTTRENIIEPLTVKGMNAQKAAKKAKKMLAEVGLANKGALYPHELSGGMKQRVAIARALALTPKVLLMDEPFGALDHKTKQDLHQLLLRLFNTHKMSIIFVTHDVNEAIYLADRTYVLNPDTHRFKIPITIPFGRPRSPNLKYSEVFKALKEEINGGFVKV